MSAPVVHKEETGSKGRFWVEVEGHVAELTFSRMSPRAVIADHTDVPDALRGKGVGLMLAEALVADARAQGYTITALCPFVRAQRMRRPDWADVIP